MRLIKTSYQDRTVMFLVIGKSHVVQIGLKPLVSFLKGLVI